MLNTRHNHGCSCIFMNPLQCVCVCVCVRVRVRVRHVRACCSGWRVGLPYFSNQAPKECTLVSARVFLTILAIIRLTTQSRTQWDTRYNFHWHHLAPVVILHGFVYSRLRGGQCSLAVMTGMNLSVPASRQSRLRRFACCACSSGTRRSALRGEAHACMSNRPVGRMHLLRSKLEHSQRLLEPVLRTSPRSAGQCVLVRTWTIELAGECESEGLTLFSALAFPGAVGK